LAADVLLAGLQRHPVCRVAVRVDRDADDPTRRLTHVPVERREESGVRAAVAHRYAETLRVAEDDVGAPLAGGRQQGETEEVRGDGDENAAPIRFSDEPGQVVDD